MTGQAYRAALPVYQQFRRLKNRLLNVIDPPVIILGYHRVADKAFDPNLVTVSPANFRAQMEHLKRTHRVARLGDDWASTGERLVVITFDDGYADNLVSALPILEELEIPATFFLCSCLLRPPGTAETHEFWWDELERLILGEGDFPERFRLLDGSHEREWSTASPEDRIGLYQDLHSLFFRSTVARRDTWLECLREWSGVPDPLTKPNRTLTAQEIRRLAASDVASIGAHTVTHTCLSSLTEAEQEREIAGSREQLQSFLEIPVKDFAYPFGSQSDYTKTSVRLCREAGFARAVSTRAGQAHRWSDPLQLPRQLVRNWDAQTFAARLESFWV